MKKLFILIIMFASGLLMITSCDIIEEPYLVKVGGNDTVAPEEKVRKILLEDFTGQQCPNCPKAADETDALKAIYGEQLVVLSVHAGVYSVPSATGLYTADYRTTEGDELNVFFAVEGYPSGMVNRTDFDGKKVMFYDSWQSAMEVQDALPAQAWISVENSYNSSTRQLDCTLETEFLEDLSGTYNICVFIAESGIVSPQKTLQGPVLEYVHNHMLRGSLNGTWGDPVGTDGLAVTGTQLSDSYTFTLPAAWNADNCAIIAFVYNTETLEVVQAEEKAVN